MNSQDLHTCYGASLVSDDALAQKTQRLTDEQIKQMIVRVYGIQDWSGDDLKFARAVEFAVLGGTSDDPIAHALAAHADHWRDRAMKAEARIVELQLDLAREEEDNDRMREANHNRLLTATEDDAYDAAAHAAAYPGY